MSSIFLFQQSTGNAGFRWPIGFYAFEAKHAKTGISNYSALQGMKPVLEDQE